MKRRFALVALGLLLGLLLIEAVAQVGAYRNWQTAHREQSGGGRVILCVGDSFTYGLGGGGPEGSYPHQLQQALDRDDITVVNGGYPGQNSRDVLLRLARQIRDHRPELVYVLVGENDGWTRPQRTTIEESLTQGAETFPVRYRTGRLLAEMIARLGRAAPPPGPTGTWHSDAHEIAFAPDGTLTFDGVVLRWRIAEDRLVVGFPGGELEVGWEQSDERLVLTAPRWQAPLVLAPGTRVLQDPLERARKALDAGQYTVARDLYRELLSDPDHALTARVGLVRAAVGLGAAVDAQKHVEVLQAGTVGRIDPDVWAAFAQALLAVGQVEEALAAAAGAVTARADTPGALEILMHHGRAPQWRHPLLRAAEAVIANPATDDAKCAELSYALSTLLQDEEPLAALRHLLVAALIPGHGESARFYLIKGRGVFTEERLDRVLATMELPPEDETRLRTVFAEAQEEDDSAWTVLRAHLSAIIAVCRELDAQPVLLTYPERKPGIDDAVRDVARVEQCDPVVIHSHFDRALGTFPREALFIPDGHCTARGYGIMARAVAEDARGRL